MVSYDSDDDVDDDDDYVDDNEDSYGDKKRNLESNGRAILLTFLLSYVPRTDVFAASFSSIYSFFLRAKQPISHYVGWLVHWLVSYDSDDDDDNVKDIEDSYGDKKRI